MESRTQTKLNTWPSPQDYNEAIQNLAANTTDAQLRSGRVHVTGLGLPRPLTGAFASVYRVDCTHTNAVAVRCFLRDLRDQEARYEHISNFVQHDTLPYTVTFDFLRRGIRVGANWFPALKMDWVNGPNLDQYVEQNLDSPHKLARLGRDFFQMCTELREAGIAHGDLQHGNIIVAEEGLRLVDYDGMFVPAMEGMQSHELGHRNYQHASRSAKHFNANLDNFSAWAIYTSISCTALDPRLWDVLMGGDDCLLFRRDDFAHPEHSYAFNVLERNQNEDIRQLARHMRWLCHQAVDEVPPLTQIPLNVPSSLPELGAPMRSAVVREQWYEALTEPVAELPQIGAVAQVVRPASVASAASLIVGVEPELNQPIPRWIASRAAINTMHPGMDELAATGIPARTIQFSLTRTRDPRTELYYFLAKYKFAVDGKVTEGETRLTEPQAIGLASIKQVTILYLPSRPAFNAIYACMPYKAVDITIPPDIEPELNRRKRLSRARKKKPHDYYYVAILTAFISVLAFVAACLYLGSFNAGLFLIALCFPFCILAHSNNVHSSLVGVGIPARARVIDVTPLSNGMVRIKYRYKAYCGAIQSHATTDDIEFGRLGGKITVLYDINHPDRHVVYKLSAYEVAT